MWIRRVLHFLLVGFCRCRSWHESCLTSVLFALVCSAGWDQDVLLGASLQRLVAGLLAQHRCERLNGEAIYRQRCFLHRAWRILDHVCAAKPRRLWFVSLAVIHTNCFSCRVCPSRNEQTTFQYPPPVITALSLTRTSPINKTNIVVAQNNLGEPVEFSGNCQVKTRCFPCVV